MNVRSGRGSGDPLPQRSFILISADSMEKASLAGQQEPLSSVPSTVNPTTLSLAICRTLSNLPSRQGGSAEGNFLPSVTRTLRGSSCNWGLLSGQKRSARSPGGVFIDLKVPRGCLRRASSLSRGSGSLPLRGSWSAGGFHFTAAPRPSTSQEGGSLFSVTSLFTSLSSLLPSRMPEGFNSSPIGLFGLYPDMAAMTLSMSSLNCRSGQAFRPLPLILVLSLSGPVDL